MFRMRVAIALISYPVLAGSLAYSQTTLALEDSRILRKENSELFLHSGSTRTLDDYINLPSTNTGKGAPKDIVLFDSPADHNWIDNPNDNTSEAYLLSSSVRSDLIVAAEPLECVSEPTEDRRFIFSDCTFAVDRVVRARGLTVLPGQKIVVTRLGGTLKYRGRTFVGSVKGFEQFRLNEPYMMFLRQLPNGTFLVIGNAAYNLQDNQVDVDPGHLVKEGDKKDVHKKLIPKDQFLEDVNHAVSRLAKVGR